MNNLVGIRNQQWFVKHNSVIEMGKVSSSPVKLDYLDYYKFPKCLNIQGE